jgi:hypothetical protein
LLPFGSLLPLLEHRADFSVFWSFTDGRAPWTGDQLVTGPLPKHRTTQTQKTAHTHQTSMPWVRFEPMITASERTKTVHALDRSATVTDVLLSGYQNFGGVVCLHIQGLNILHIQRHKPPYFWSQRRIWKVHTNVSSFICIDYSEL